MTTNATEIVAERPGLIDDITLNEDNLSEEAKRRFDYHTKILERFQQNRRHVLANNQISPIGRHILLIRLAGLYENCKRVLNYATAHPEILNDSLPSFGPLIICGLPRTGSTLLYNLLACDPNCRAPLMIEMAVECVPPMSRSDTVERERRLQILQQNAEVEKQLTGQPSKLRGSHPAFLIEEDTVILRHVGLYFVVPWITPLNQSESSKLAYDKTNKDFLYAYHETFLRVLNSVDKPSSHWLLKMPFHSLYFDALLKQYPNASLIMTHRYLNEVVPSFCRLVSINDFFFDKTNSTAPKILKTRALEHMDKIIESVVEFRSSKNNKHVEVRKTLVDVFYDDLMSDPIGVVRQIYHHFGLHWSQEFEKAMETWLQENPQGIQGRNSYNLSDFGLTEEDIRARYAAYIDLFPRVCCSSEESVNTKNSQ